MVGSSSLANRGDGSIVQVSEAPPNRPFGPPQTLSAPAKYKAPVTQLRMAGNGGPEHLIQWQLGKTNRRSKRPFQPTTATPFQPLGKLLAHQVRSLHPFSKGLAMDQAGETISLL